MHKTKMLSTHGALLGLLLGLCVNTGWAADDAASTSTWSVEKANAWYAKQPWLVGANFTPASAINQLEMWQAETFDPAGIDRELKWASELGLTSMRVYLHDIPWKTDREGYLKRLEKYLEISDKHKIGTMFVFFDSCWDPHPKGGKQRDPRPHVHNSGWVQSPGAEYLKDPARHDELKDYVNGVVRHFRNDKRVQIWDVYNEPDNWSKKYKAVELADKPDAALALMKKAFAWVREAGPSQPITSAVWVGNWGDPEKLNPTERFQLENSDIISFHNYSSIDRVMKCVENLKRYKRPILCTEYIARPQGSTFDPIMGYLKAQKVGAYNWGFVQGKTQTIYPWDSWEKEYKAEPPVWFHDILRTDGTPYNQTEVDYIKKVTGKLEPADQVTSGSH